MEIDERNYLRRPPRVTHMVLPADKWVASSGAVAHRIKGFELREQVARM